MREIYLDNAAGTPVDARVIRAVAGAMRETGNPASFNDAGRRVRQQVEGARAGVARFLHARPGEVVFFSSASDANREAIRSVLDGAHGFAHAVVTAVEHRSVLEAFNGRNRKALTVVRVDEVGRVSAADIAAAITRWTVLVSVMYANNEIGTIQPVQAIAKVIRAYRRRTGRSGPYLHVDASQAAGYLPMDVQALGVDILTCNGSKVHGPRGIAALYVRRGVRAEVREGRVDPAAAVGFAEALQFVKPADAVRVGRMRDRAIAGILKAVPDAKLNGPQGKERLANNVNISVPDATSEELLLELDRRGIRAGSGSACTAYSVEPSHVLRAIGVPKKHLNGALRFTLSRDTTDREVDILVRALPGAVAAVRRRHS